LGEFERPSSRAVRGEMEMVYAQLADATARQQELESDLIAARFDADELRARLRAHGIAEAGIVPPGMSSSAQTEDVPPAALIDLDALRSALAQARDSAAVERARVRTAQADARLWRLRAENERARADGALRSARNGHSAPPSAVSERPSTSHTDAMAPPPLQSPDVLDAAILNAFAQIDLAKVDAGMRTCGSGGVLCCSRLWGVLGGGGASLCTLILRSLAS